MSLQKLAQISLETELFLRMLVSDVDKRIVGAWVAKDFDNNSVDFTAEYVGQITPDQVQACRRALAYTMTEELDFTDLDANIRRSTLLQYAKIARHIDPDEAVYFHLLNGDSTPSKSHVYTKEQALEIEQRLKLSDTIQYEGSIQGVITALFKGTDPHCRVKELHSGLLIPCYFSYNLYNQVIEALHDLAAVVHVAGLITASRTERRPIDMRIHRIESAEPYLDGDLEKFIGCAPEATGDLSTHEFLDLIRNGDDLVLNSEEIA